MSIHNRLIKFLLLTCSISAFSTEVTVGDAKELRNAILKEGNTEELTITISQDIELSSILPPLCTDQKFMPTGVNMTIQGNNARERRKLYPKDNKKRSGFFIRGNGEGTVVIKDIEFDGCAAKGGKGGVGKGGGGGGAGLGAGGALFVGSGADVVIENVVFENCRAIGGKRGKAQDGYSSGGGGGGFKGRGGNSGDDPLAGAGGGGGFKGRGGHGAKGEARLAGSGGGGGGSKTRGLNGNLRGGGGSGGKNFAKEIGGRGGSIGGGDGQNGESGRGAGGGGGANFRFDTQSRFYEREEIDDVEGFLENLGDGVYGGDGGNGGVGGGGGGGGPLFSDGGDGGEFGGGGGGSMYGNGGSGDFAGGGGGGGYVPFRGGGTGGDGGFGAGGGGGGYCKRPFPGVGQGGSGGFGAENGENARIPAGPITAIRDDEYGPGRGGAGAGLGGAIFIQDDGKLTIKDYVEFRNNSATGGNRNAKGLGSDIFMMSGSLLTFDLNGDDGLTIRSDIAGDEGAGGGSTTANGIVKKGSQFLRLLGKNTYTGVTKIEEGSLRVFSDESLGSYFPMAGLHLAGGTLEIIGEGEFMTDRPIALSAPSIIRTNNMDGALLNGAISGAGSLQVEGASTLNLAGSNTYTGGTTVDHSILMIENETALGQGPLSMENSTLVVVADSTFNSDVVVSGLNAMVVEGDYTFTIDGEFSGEGRLQKFGEGELSIHGQDPYLDAEIDVYQGTIDLDETVLPHVTLVIEPGATLRGNVTSGPLTNMGTIAPGNSIGTITIDGDFIQDLGGLYQAEIAPNGDSDLIMTTGNAELGGTLQVLPLSGTGFYPSGTVYTIVQSAGTIMDAFDVIDSGPFFFALSEDGASQLLFLTLTQGTVLFTNNCLESSNSGKVATYLESCPVPAGSPLEVLLTPLASLSGSSLMDALNQISPARFGALTQTSFRSDRTVANVFASQLGQIVHCDENAPCFREKSWDVWLQPFFYLGDQHKVDRQRPYDGNAYGGVLGIDYLFCPSVLFGGGFGYSYSDIDWEKNLGNAHIHSLYGALYSSYCGSYGFAHLSIMGTRNFYHANRHVKFTGFKEIAKSSHNGWDITGHFKGGLKFSAPWQLNFQPAFDLYYINVFESSFNETSGSSIKLKVNNKYSAFLRSMVALNIIKNFTIHSACMAFGVHGGWIYDAILSSGNRKAKLKAVTCSGDFSVRSYHKNRNRGSVGANLVTYINDWFSMQFIYRYEFGGRYHEHDGSLRFDWNF